MGLKAERETGVHGDESELFVERLDSDSVVNISQESTADCKTELMIATSRHITDVISSAAVDVKSALLSVRETFPSRDTGYIITLGDIYLSWSAQIKYFGWYFRGKQCAVDPSSFIGIFYGTFNNILNVMGNSRNEMSALYLIQTSFSVV